MYKTEKSFIVCNCTYCMFVLIVFQIVVAPTASFPTKVTVTCSAQIRPQSSTRSAGVCQFLSLLTRFLCLCADADTNDVLTEWFS